MMALSQEVEQLVKQVARKFEEASEWPLTSLEDLAIEEDAQQGFVETTARIRNSRFAYRLARISAVCKCR